MGPLTGVKVVEIAGIGPGPFCGMMLSDMGAEVVTVDRAPVPLAADDPLQRNRLRLVLDLKSSDGVEAVLRLAEQADVLFEGFRPGVAERLGFGPETCLARNPGLVYGRMTGWGQDGPLAATAGHDINYIALSGALKAFGTKGGKPVPPLNLVGDYGGGGMMLAFGILCALLEARRSGRGQVVDAAMLDGTIALLAGCMGQTPFRAACDETGAHLLAGASHVYDTYRTQDGEFIAIGALEPHFYALLIEKLGLDPDLFANRNILAANQPDEAEQARLKEGMAAAFASRTRDEWCALLEGTDVCFAPVLSLSEAPDHPHNRARQNFIRVDGFAQNAPAPRFSKTPAATPCASVRDRAKLHTRLADWGLDQAAADAIIAAGRW